MSTETLYRVKAATLGTHIGPKGPLTITHDRVRGWVEKYKTLAAEGIEFPTPWGHQLRAIPIDDAEARKWALSRYNAGYIRGMEQDPNDGSLIVIGTAPPGYAVDPGTKHLINTRDNTRIGEVSIAVGNWTDGKGRKHPDIVVHSALVPRPVIAGQTGFEPVADSEITPPPNLSPGDYPSLELTNAFGGDVEIINEFATKTNDFAEGEAMATKKMFEPEADDADDVDTTEPVDMEPETEPDRIMPETPTGDASEQAARVIGLLQAVGVKLPAGTTGSNILDKLESALSVLHDQGFKLSAAKDGADGMQDIDYSVSDDATIDSAKNAGMGGMNLMSTSTGELIELNGIASKMAANQATERRALLAKEWSRLEALGLVPRDIAAREAADVFTAVLSFDPDTAEITIPSAQSRLNLAKELTAGTVDLENSLATAEVEANPVHRVKDDESEKQKEIQESLQEIAEKAYGTKVTIRI